MQALTISDINKYINQLMSSDEILNHVILKGELSNFKIHSSGHCYMSMKDDNSSIRAVMFRSNFEKIRFVPENGMNIIASGYISVYERDGSYQLYITDMNVDGIGNLQKAFEQLKNKLCSEGLFDPSIKKQIPLFPKTIGVVTSPTGAALRDIINVISRRYPCVEIIILPVLVQGNDSARQISTAIKYANDNKLCDTLIVGRGGGSMEDLWSFNEECVAYAVAESNIPVISAVGHETDFTIIDFVADMRAPTPSAAAEVAVPDILELGLKINKYREQMYKLITKTIGVKRDILYRFKMKKPIDYINQKKIHLDMTVKTLKLVTEKNFNNNKLKYESILATFEGLNPIKILRRGYASVTCDEKTVKSIKEISENSTLNVRVSDGNINCKVIDITSLEGV